MSLVGIQKKKEEKKYNKKRDFDFCLEDACFNKILLHLQFKLEHVIKTERMDINKLLKIFHTLFVIHYLISLIAIHATST